MRFRTPILSILAIGLPVLAVAAWVDTAPYRAAVAEMETDVASAGLQANGANMQVDLQHFAKCNLRTESPDMPLRPEARTCLIERMPQTRTDVGAIAMAAIASVWLMEHPDDTEVRETALRAIQNGRDYLVAHKATYLDKLDRMIQAHNDSFVLTLRDGHKNESALFKIMADQLDAAEFSVLIPEVVQKQGQWRVHAITGRLVDKANS